MKNEAIIYTDGSSGKNRDGGYCAIVVTPVSSLIVSGSEIDTTNNRMEILAAIQGLRQLGKPHKVYLISDSAYMLNTIKHKWYQRWMGDETDAYENGQIKGKYPRPNLDLWIEFASLIDYHKIQPIKVRGHSNVEYNEWADRLAVNSRQGKLPYLVQEFDPSIGIKETLIKRAQILHDSIA